MADQQPVRVSYQLTLEDYSEANRAHFGNRPWLIWPFFGVIAIYPLFLNVMNTGVAQQPASDQDSPWVGILRALLPLIVCLVISAVVTIKIARLNGQPWRRRGKNGIVSVRAGVHAKFFTFALVAVACVSLIIFRIYTALGTTPPDPLASPVIQAVFELVPGLIIVGFFLVMCFFTAGDRYGRAWQLQTNLHRPIFADVNDNGLVLDEAYCQSRYAWANFPGYMESANLFLIYVTALSFHIIPKRAFLDENQIEQVRGRLKRYIAEPPQLQVQPQPGFPVMAVPVTQVSPPGGAATPPPLPTVRQ